MNGYGEIIREQCLEPLGMTVTRRVRLKIGYNGLFLVSSKLEKRPLTICLDIVRRHEYPLKIMATQRTNRTEKLDLRLSKSAKQTLQAGARVAHKSVSEFVLETALSEAEERLADRRVFTLDAKQWESFITALDAPPRHHARIERLFREPSVFDAEP